jgi:CheY-like chemotaxis protein
MTDRIDTSQDSSAHRWPIVVLLVDDQALVGIAVKRLLAQDTDITVHCCLVGGEAVARAHQLCPTVILQDLVMPGIDGLTLVSQFQCDPSTAHTPVIVLSGNDDQATRARAKAAGAIDFLVKLPTRDELVGCIRRHAMGQTAPATASAPDPTVTTGHLEDEVTFDPSVMAGLREASSDFAMDLVDLFIDDAEARLATLRTAAGLDDGGELGRTAHCLKGSALTMGARKMAGLCALLESHAKAASSDRATLASLIAAISDELGEVSLALTRDASQAQAMNSVAGNPAA